MSTKYKHFLEEKRLLEQKHASIQNQLKSCENEAEKLRLRYSKDCDHPVRIAQFPVCAVCYQLVTTSATTSSASKTT